MELFRLEFESPVGVISLVSDGGNLRALDFEDYESRLQKLLARHYGPHVLRPLRGACDAAARLRDYFAGDVSAIAGVSVATNGTAFQKRVWSALREVPAGTVVTYGAIAARIGQPTACRAVGLANGSNPIGIVVPCHRVVGADGGLTGYGGGIERKRWLLSHERASPDLRSGTSCESLPQALRGQAATETRLTTKSLFDPERSCPARTLACDS